MTGVALHATPAGVPRPVLLYGGELPIPRDAQPFCYPVESLEDRERRGVRRGD